MDDPKGPQASTLDELVKEIGRPQSTPPPSNLPRPSAPTTPLPSTLPPPIQKPTPPLASNQIPPVVKPSPVMPTPITKPLTPPEEYQSSIRTMKDDVAKISSGQKIGGMTIPRKIESPTPAGPQVFQSAPTSSFKPISPPVNVQTELGKTQKASPLPLTSVPKPIPSPQSLSRSSSSSPVLTVPPSSSGPNKINTKLIFTSLAAVAVLGGFFYWFLVLRDNNSITLETPLPTSTESPTPTPVSTLATIFPNFSGRINLPLSGEVQKELNSQLNNQITAPGSFNRVEVLNGETSLSMTQLLDRLLINYPADLKLSLGSDSAILIFGQREGFTSKGLPMVSPGPNSKRLALAVEVANRASLNSVLKNWEPSMAENLATLLNFQISKDKKGFLDNSYQGVPIRYRNFSYPDNSLDYAVVVASNGKSYLVFTNSREAMYSAILKMISSSN